MSYALAVYNNGYETVYNATPYNLFHVVSITDLAAGVHQFTLPTNPAGGEVSFVWGLERSSPDQTISLGGSGTSKMAINDITISGNTVTVDIQPNAFGILEILLSFFYSR
ncbi:hypothetical protein [Shewanella algae]|jgi:hypothetical protein|uniref:hypothetical protein n=1 Tax=Shewanella algae TaxID=38313 RepID=UPI00118506DA|nr:hypothetical protein [Shewanella algae]TVP04724.1 hypothetical protein AYI73_15700 [Shewanella algae]